MLANATPAFNQELTAAVYSAALSFILPRAIIATPVSQLALWGLQGLSALDPELAPRLTPGNLELDAGGRVVLRVPAPAFNNPDAWGLAAASICAAAWRDSVLMQRAGPQAIVDGFFQEMLGHLDPYSRYVPPQEALADEARRSGSAGIGISLTRRGNWIVVSSMTPEGPAYSVGIRPGDRIIYVARHVATGRPLATVENWLAGPAGSIIAVSWRGTTGRLHTADITRELIPPKTVFPEQRKAMLLLRLSGFSRDTDERVATDILQAVTSRRPSDGLVVDLRGNRGGLLAQAVAVADELLPEGTVAVQIGRDPAATRVWRSPAGELAKGTPVIVLVDASTASAAEVLAAALADRGRAVVVGSSTTGKGLVQAFTALPDGGELYVTWSQILAPRGWPIQGLGVLPQVCTSLGDEELDRQLNDLSQGEQPMEPALIRARSARAPLSPLQIEDIRATCPAAEGTSADLLAARYLIANPAAYAAALLPPMRFELPTAP